MDGTAPTSLLAIESASECELLLWVQAKVDRLLLEEISANDRGEDAAKHLAAIQEQLRPWPPLGMLPWWPLEALQLEGLRAPERSSVREHIKRLLACTILLRNAAYLRSPDWSSDEGMFLEASATTLIQLTGSALALDVPKRALGFVLWLLEVRLYPGLKPFAAFCALVLAAATSFGKASEAQILEICNWVDSEEQRYRNVLGDQAYSERWLLGLNLHANKPKQNRERWSAVARHVIEHSKERYSEGVGDALRRFSSRLHEE